MCSSWATTEAGHRTAGRSGQSTKTTSSAVPSWCSGRNLIGAGCKPTSWARCSDRADLGFHRVDHHVDVVAVHAVQPHPEALAQFVFVLQIPAERDSTEAVEEHDESPVPIASIQVDPVDSRAGERVSTTFGPLLDAFELGRLQQADPVGDRAKCGEPIEIG